MNQIAMDRWKSEVLDEVFAALAADRDLQACLVFKGARVLNTHLQGGRQSLDLDSNLAQSFVELFPDRVAQKIYLERHLRQAIIRYFERQDPVRFQLTGMFIKDYPPNSHPMGWDAFKVKLSIEDSTKAGIRALPGIEIDVAAPEALLESSISPIIVRGFTARAYTIERIAGEKLRAFLSSLPEYRAKLRKPGEAVRAKDLYDLARINRRYSIEDRPFWETVGREFRLACSSRFVDCSGIETFLQKWEVTASAYSNDPTIPAEIDIHEARFTLERIITSLVSMRIIPCYFPLPL